MRTILRTVVILCLFAPYLWAEFGPGPDARAPVGSASPAGAGAWADGGLRPAPPGPEGSDAAPPPPAARPWDASPGAPAPTLRPRARPGPRRVAAPPLARRADAVRVRPVPGAPPAGLVEAGPGWAGVGIVRIGSTRLCTGSLVGDDLVLTAAHCVLGEDGAPVAPEGIGFLAGYRGGRSVASARVADLAAAPGYDPGGQGAARALDVALLRLERPLRDGRVVPLPLGDPPRAGDPVSVVSYAQGRSEAPSIEAACSVLEVHGASVVTDCIASPGASGSPVLRMVGGRPAVISVISGGTIGDRGRSLTVAAGLGSLVDELAAALDARREAPGRPRARGAAGAKFVRP